MTIGSDDLGIGRAMAAFGDDDPDGTSRTTAHFDMIAPIYESQVTVSPEAQQWREAFWLRVAAEVDPGQLLLDSGCGTGIDAKHYAQHGYTVIAYDVSRGMMDILRTRCDAEIRTGQIVPVVGDLGSLARALETQPRLSAVTAFHAPLNHIRHLAPIFEFFASRLVARGCVLASMINLLSGSDMRQRWWWREGARAVIAGTPLTMRGDTITFRHSVRSLKRMAKPHFDLVQCSAQFGALLRSPSLQVTLRKRR